MGDAPRPHLVVILADQLRCDMLGAYHTRNPDGAAALAPAIRLTPKLDILARRSTVFERHFTPCPLCLPAKASLLSGLEPLRHGAIINGFFTHERKFGVVRQGVTLLPTDLLARGYRVIHAGVQHLRAEPSVEQRCPDAEFVGPSGATDHYHALTQRGLYLGDLTAFRDPVIDMDLGKPVVHTAVSSRVGQFPLREELFYDNAVATHTAAAVERYARGPTDRPLALFVNFWLPHPPLWAPRKFASMVQPEMVKLPATVGRWYAGQPPLHLTHLTGQLGAHVTAEHWQKAWAMYMGMTALLDACVGRVLAALDHAGLFEDAMVVFTSDHGEMLGSHALFQKNCLYDEAVRVPLLVKLPAQSSPRRCAELTDHLDLHATLCEMTGVVRDEATSGRSLLSQCIGSRVGQPRRAVYGGYDGNAGRGFHQRMVRTRTHKFIHNFTYDPELYDLVEDPYETRNLAGKPEHHSVETDLRELLRQWMTKVGDEQKPMP